MVSISYGYKILIPATDRRSGDITRRLDQCPARIFRRASM